MAHRSTLKNRQKAFKTRHSSKGSIKAANKGRIDKEESHGAGKHVMGKTERRNMKNQLRATKQSQLVERNKIFEGRNGVPRNVAIIPLTPDVDGNEVAQKFISSLGCSTEGLGTVYSSKFRQRIRFFVPSFDKFFEMLDCARSADFVLFVLSANTEITDYGEQIVRCITLQGVTTSLGLIWGLSQRKTDSAAPKEKDIRDSLTSWFSYFFADERLYSIDKDSELAIAGRLLCQRTPRGLHWRDERPYIVLEKAQVLNTNMIVEGSVRGQQLSPDAYIHIHNYGDFKIARIESVPSSNVGEPQVWEPTEARTLERLVSESEAQELEDDDEGDIEHLEGKGVRVDGHTDVTRLIDANTEDNTPQRAKNVPEGTSEYQAAWFVEGEDYASDVEAEDEGALTDEEGELVDNQANADAKSDEDAMSEDSEESGSESEGDEDSEMDHSDFDPEDIPKEKDIAAQAKDDLEFPDEIELDPRVSGKDRLKRYRGVQSIRHSDWNPREKDPRMPAEFTRLFRPGNLVAAKNRIGKLLSTGAPAGTKVRVFLESNEPSASQQDPMEIITAGASLTAYGLLPGEEKLGYVSASVAMDSEVTEPIKSKQQIVVQYGPRRLLINPLFNQDGYADNHVHKLHRFLHPGRAAVATFIAPILLGNAPAVFYNTEFKNERILIGAGSVQDCDANRIIVKTAILTGLPVKIHRKLVTIRHMFFSREDVEWFSQVPLFTKLGAQGFIKEALGTHGLFKATFDKKIRSEDTIALPLYKRAWPKLASPALF